jgi:hypothetical protein
MFMTKKVNWRGIALMIGAFALISVFTVANAIAAGPGTVTMTVTAVGKKNTNPPAIGKDDVELYVNKERSQVADWQRGEKLYLAVVIDDSLDSDVAGQWADLKAFFAAQPDTTYISVSYARNGTAMVAQDFTNNHELAAKALRIPIGAGAFSSPYLTLLDFMKRWPSSGDRRSILLLSSGIDYFHGNFPTSPDVDSVIQRAQKQNINVWSIYYPDAGHLARGFFRASRGQSDLSRLAEETGAETYSLGFGLPVTLKPYFDELSTHLNNQYLLTFSGNGGKKGKFERVRVTTELANVEFLTPSAVFLPAVQ